MMAFGNSRELTPAVDYHDSTEQDLHTPEHETQLSSTMSGMHLWEEGLYIRCDMVENHATSVVLDRTKDTAIVHEEHRPPRYGPMHIYEYQDGARHRQPHSYNWSTILSDLAVMLIGPTKTV